MKTSTPAVAVNEESDIATILYQREATQDAIRLLHYIYSEPSPEALSVDNQSCDVKYVVRSSNHNNNKKRMSSSDFQDKSIYPYLHPDAIGYYIYTLEKIVI